MSFWKQLNPMYTPPAIARQGELMVLREKILHTVLLFFATFGIVEVGLAVQQAQARSIPLLPYMYGAIYLAVLVMAFFRGIPYTIRGVVACALLYLLAIAELGDSGMLGEVRTFLIAFTAFTALLFDYRWMIAAVLFGQVTIATVGVYVDTSTAPLGALVHYNDGTPWVMASLMYLILSGIIAGSISILIRGLGGYLKQMAEISEKVAAERDSLDARIQDRTSAINSRMVEMRTAAEITKTISALTDPEELLQQVVDLIKDRFNLYYVGIFLLDSQRQNAVLRAGTGDPGKRMLSAGHQLSVSGSSMIGWSVTNRRPRIALDVGAERVRFNNPNLPRTRSEMALPLIAHDEVIGAMTIQSERANAFEQDDITILESIADSIAIALDNDRLYHEIRQRLEEVRTLNRDYLDKAWAETLETFGELSYDFDNPASEPAGQPVTTRQLPLLLRDEVVGYITLEMDRPELTSEEQSFVDNITTQTAIALENARLLHETERRVSQEQKLNELATRFSRAVSIEEILRTAAQELGQITAVAEVSVQLNPAAPASYPTTGKVHTGALRLPGANGKEQAK